LKGRDFSPAISLGQRVHRIQVHHDIRVGIALWIVGDIAKNVEQRRCQLIGASDDLKNGLLGKTPIIVLARRQEHNKSDKSDKTDKNRCDARPSDRRYTRSSFIGFIRFVRLIRLFMLFLPLRAGRSLRDSQLLRVVLPLVGTKRWVG
jgi:hypothetical protein